jgi:uncharacterized protein YjiS (DUF1127 family)
MSVQSRKSFVHQPHDLATPAAPRPSLRARITAMLVLWRGRVAARRYLAALDARSLRDAGISPAAAAYECGKPFWQKMGPLR